MKRKRKNTRRRSSEAVAPQKAEAIGKSTQPQAGVVATVWKGRLTELRGSAIKRAKRFLSWRFWLLVVVHQAVFATVYWLSFVLRHDYAVNAKEFWTSYCSTVAVVLAVKFFVFWLSDQYEGWWTYVTFSDLIALVRASVFATGMLAVVEYFFTLTQYTPREVLIMDLMGTIAVLSALRGSWRVYREQFWPIFNPGEFRWALLVGTDHSTGLLASQIQSCRELAFRIRGLVAMDDDVVGSRMGQIPILGKLDDIAEIISVSHCSAVLVTAGTLAGPRLRNLMDVCKDLNIELKIIRPIQDRLSGDHRIPIRDIEISDLLRRAPVQLDSERIGALIEGRIVMVTGAGGSIGSEICRQLLRFKPAKLVLLGRGENRIFKVERKLHSSYPNAVLISCIADVTDLQRMRQIFNMHRPEVVFHAAAHKHVPLMELNVGEAIRNNVLGAKTMADLSSEFRVRNFVFISTDKAVHPTSIMGVSKQISERYVHAMSQISDTTFNVVRFGNVLGSEGSVVPIFQEQIRRGGPITVTDPRMTRFFMTIPEASQLVLQAAAMGKGGEIFVLEMGEPVKIVDLARDLIRLSGLPEDSVEIVYTGIRPGEKLYEELYLADEETLPTAHPKLRAAYHRPYTIDEVRETVCQLATLIHAPESKLRQKLCEVVEEYAWQVQKSKSNAASCGPDEIAVDVNGSAPARGGAGLLPQRGAPPT